MTITPQCRNGRHAVCNGAVAGDECDCECHDNPTPVRVEVAPRSPDGVPAVVLVRNGLPDQVLYPCRVITCDREFPTEQGEKVHFARAHPDKLAEDVIPPPPPGPDSLLAQQMERDAQERAVVRDGEVVVRPVANISITFDHRVVDGARAAAFTLSVIGRLESGTI